MIFQGGEMIRLLMVLLTIIPVVIGIGGRDREPATDPCLHGIVVRDGAEQMAGGANYVVGNGRYCRAPLITAHDDHDPQHGGTFFMAPNGIHHVEFLYSKKCGAEVVLYNSYTQEINASRQLLGMVRVIPSSEEEAETIRFLRPSTKGILLAADIGSVTRPFELEFNLQFPNRVEPDMFNVLVGR